MAGATSAGGGGSGAASASLVPDPDTGGVVDGDGPRGLAWVASLALAVPATSVAALVCGTAAAGLGSAVDGAEALAPFVVACAGSDSPFTGPD